MLAVFAALLASIEGTYLVTGFESRSDTKPWYQGTAEISKAGEVYHIVWSFVLEGKEYSDLGTGLKVGEQLSFSFMSSPAQEESYSGLQVYKIKGDTLEGPFVLLGDKKVGFERMKKSS